MESTESVVTVEEESLPVISEDSVVLRETISRLRDQNLRLQAEFENFRKRMNRENERIRRVATESLMQDLLQVLDHFELALAEGQDRTDPSWAKGIDLIFRQFGEVLQRYDLRTCSAEIGAVFDPNLHEAIEEVATNEVPSGRIARVIRKGYLLGPRLLRPAQVAVARECPDESKGTEKAEFSSHGKHSLERKA
ncbi:MAG: nucleotide exchange factor GrpE [Candidatus Hydrogenedentota bacterium]|nr:MAG: nucleotide exchange factor GrpE [Candidatus Hydrogenedentota bacterium]